MLYRVFRMLAALVLRVFFRRIEVEGLGNVPASGPLLLVSNHANALVDPLLPLILVRRRITLTGKNVLSRNPLLGLLFRGLGAVAFHRTEDVAKGANPRENVRSMQRCREILAAGGAICIYPEGISHSDRKMREFHSGAARIALDFVKKDGNPGALKIVPVGLLYAHKDRFRSNVWLRFGAPMDLAEWMARQGKAGAEVLTEALRQQIEALVVSYESRREMLLVQWAAEIIATRGRMPRALGSAEPSAAEGFEQVRHLQAGYRALCVSRGPEVEAVGERIRAYRAALKMHGVSPEEVYLPLHPLRAALFVVREMELMVVGFPLAAFGWLNHFIPYWVVRKIARLTSRDRDHWATNVVYPSFAVFPLFYVVQIAAAWLLLPALWAALYTVALPYTGYYAVLYSDRIGDAFRRAYSFCHFLLHRDVQRALARESHDILQAIYALAAHLPSPPEVPALPPLAKEHA